MYKHVVHIAHDEEEIKRSLCTLAGKCQSMAEAVKTNRSHIIAQQCTLNQMQTRIGNMAKEVEEYRESHDKKDQLVEDKFEAIEEATS